VQGFAQRHQDGALDILAPLGEGAASPPLTLPLAERAGAPAASAEELLEEIAEPRAVEMEFGALPGAAARSA
jgi:hypothetical protein